MDPAVTKKLHDAFRKTLEDPQVLATFEKYDQSVIYMNTEAYTKFATMKLRYALGERVELDADVALDAKVTVTDARERVASGLAKLAAVAGR